MNKTPMAIADVSAVFIGSYSPGHGQTPVTDADCHIALDRTCFT